MTREIISNMMEALFAEKGDDIGDHLGEDSRDFANDQNKEIKSLCGSRYAHQGQEEERYRNGREKDSFPRSPQHQWYDYEKSRARFNERKSSSGYAKEREREGIRYHHEDGESSKICSGKSETRDRGRNFDYRVKGDRERSRDKKKRHKKDKKRRSRNTSSESDLHDNSFRDDKNPKDSKVERLDRSYPDKDDKKKNKKITTSSSEDEREKKKYKKRKK